MSRLSGQMQVVVFIHLFILYFIVPLLFFCPFAATNRPRYKFDVRYEKDMVGFTAFLSIGNHR